jgi:four helix bundle protein
MDKGYKKLIVWQKADELAYQVCLETKKFPKDEIYGITSQLRRAAISIPTNIVEGTGRQGKNELRQFINIALGSLAETEYLLEFCSRLGYLNKESYNKLESLRKEVGGLLWNFYKSFNG